MFSPVWGSTPAAHVASKQPETRFCRISKTPLHSQLAKPQHSNVTWDQVLLERNMTFHINFHSASPFCRAQPEGVGGGEDRAGHPACLCSSLGCLGTQTPRESSALMLPSSSVIYSLPKSREEVFCQAAFSVQRHFACAEAALLSPLPTM